MRILLDSLRPLLGPDTDRRWGEFVARRGEDPASFLAELRADGTLGATRFADLLGVLEVQIDPDRAPGAPGLESLGLLGKGAMGEVHVAIDRRLQRAVAVKRLSPELVGHRELSWRFTAEAQITAQLDHPGIVPVYGFDTVDGSLSYAMKLVRGKTLGEWLDETRSFYAERRRPDASHGLAARLEVFVQVCAAVDHAHARGVIHRDLKPDNIMLGAWLEVLVMDWGIARRIGGAEPLGSAGIAPGRGALTEAGMVLGTPGYLSPEQAEGHNDTLDGRSDQYALGLVLFELVSLRRAVTGPTNAMLVARACEGELDPLTHLDPGESIRPELAAIIAKATALRPEDRYPSVQALGDDVRRFLRDEPVLARPDRLLQRAQRWISRHREATLTLVFALVSALILGGAGVAIGGMGALLAWQRHAAAREQQITSALVAVTAQARRIDDEFRRYEQLLAELAGAAEASLGRNPPAQAMYTSRALDPQPAGVVGSFDAGGPPDLELIEAYGVPISLGWPDLTPAHGVDSAPLATQMRQLHALQPKMLGVLLRSQSDVASSWVAARQREAVRARSLPVVWVNLATEDGLLVALPGTSAYPDEYDPRTTSWYRAGIERRSPRWSPPYEDESGMGLLVPASVGLWDAEGRQLGVAAVDITIGYVAEKLIHPPDLGGPLSAWLIDEQGKVIAARDDASFAFAGELTPEGGWSVVDGQLVAWSPLHAVPWTYVVAGPLDRIGAP